MYRSNPFRSPLNTSVITDLDIKFAPEQPTSRNAPKVCSQCLKRALTPDLHWGAQSKQPTTPNPPRTETVLTVNKMDINTLFTLESTCEKKSRRQGAGRNGTTTAHNNQQQPTTCNNFQQPTTTFNNQQPTTANNKQHSFSRCCLGKSRTVRPSVSEAKLKKNTTAMNH